MPSNMPVAGECWEHHDGRVYTILSVPNQKSTKPGWEVRVVYRDDAGEDWDRPLSEFLEKFTHLSSAPEMDDLVTPQPEGAEEDWDTPGLFMLQLTTEEYYTLSSRQHRNTETLEDTLLRRAGLRSTPSFLRDDAYHLRRQADDSVVMRIRGDRLHQEEQARATTTRHIIVE